MARILGPCWGVGSSDDSRGLEDFSPASLNFLRTALRPRPPLPNFPPSLPLPQGLYVYRGLLRGLGPTRVTSCGPWTRSCITWELVRNTECLAPTQTYQTGAFISADDSYTHCHLRKHCLDDLVFSSKSFKFQFRT